MAAMTAPPVVVLSKLPEEMEEMAKVVEVALDVVALPLIVRLPWMVEEAAFTMKPFRKATVVEVETPYVVAVNGKMAVSEEDDILLLKSVQLVLER